MKNSKALGSKIAACEGPQVVAPVDERLEEMAASDLGMQDDEGAWPTSRTNPVVVETADETVEDSEGMRMQPEMLDPFDEVVERIEYGLVKDEDPRSVEAVHVVDEAFEVVSADGDFEGLGVDQVVEAILGLLPRCRRLSSMQV